MNQINRWSRRIGFKAKVKLKFKDNILELSLGLSLRILFKAAV
jgi:hypothetical protein